MNATAIDIGGANIKCRHSSGEGFRQPFELWRQPSQLCDQLLRLLDRLPRSDQILITMTGELADCYPTRRFGVLNITAQVIAAAARRNIAEPWFYTTSGHFIRQQQVIADPMKVAAANWHATAQYWAHRHRESAIVVDIGSTTTDLTRIDSGGVVSPGSNDLERLKSGGLLYVGSARTPVCSIVDTLPDRGETVPVMNEFFATMDDVRLLLGYAIPESNGDTGAAYPTANGRPRTVIESATRMLRMIGTDLDDRTLDDATTMARSVHNAVTSRLKSALDRFPSDDPLIAISDADELVTALVGENDEDIRVHRLRRIIRSGQAGDFDFDEGPCEALLSLWANQRIEMQHPPTTHQKK